MSLRTFRSSQGHSVDYFLSLQRLTESADELSQATGQTCISAQADVRRPEQLKEAVAKTIEKFGRIDFVICGMVLGLTFFDELLVNRREQVRRVTSSRLLMECRRTRLEPSWKSIPCVRCSSIHTIYSHHRRLERSILSKLRCPISVHRSARISTLAQRCTTKVLHKSSSFAQ